MLTVEVWMEIKVLRQQGHSIRAISEMTGHARNTVRKQLRQGESPRFQSSPRQSKLDRFKPYLEERYGQCRLSSVRLYAEIRAMGYDGSLDVVQRFMRAVRPDKATGTRLTVRFETPPGEQAQSDWAYCGRFIDRRGQPVSIYAFVCVLGYSRLRYVEFTTSMRIEQLLRCQKNAFAFFEGIPRRLLFDNMKQVKLDGATWNPLFLDFARHYGVAAHTHAPYRPRTKGKVERLVRYLKDNFLNGRSFDDLDDVNAQGRAWMSQVNAQVHGTTGQIPREAWRQHEQGELRALDSVAPYQLCRQVTRKVDWEGLVRFDGSRYSVPPSHAGHRVTVELRGQQITVRRGELIVATHEAAARADSHVVQTAHVEALWKATLRRASQRAAPLPRWQMSFAHEVERADLGHYERLAEPNLVRGVVCPHFMIQ